MLSSLINPYRHMISVIVVAMLLYSASAELLETVDCFFDFHENKEPLYSTKYPVTDLFVWGQEDQSASQYVVIVVSGELDSKTP